MKPIIRVENLSKQYVMGVQSKPYATLRESLVETARAPLKAMRRNGADRKNAFWALNDVSFEVYPGEVIGIVGRNGAGKSTLLKILSRITEPTRGKVELYGRIGSLLEVGTGFHPELSGRENVFLNGAILGMSRHEIARKFDEIVAFAEVESFLDTPVKHYSSGMYTRLAFAVAANLEPEVLIVDEVLAVGDAAFQKKCLGKMKDVSAAGRTVLFVSHNMSAVTQLCTHGIMLKNGVVEYKGLTANVVEKYLSDTANVSVYSAEENDKPAQILAASVVDRNRVPITDFAHNDEINLEIKLKNFAPETDMRCSIGVWDMMETLISIQVIDVPPQIGYQTYKMTIPGNCLAPNKLKFSVALFRPNNLIDLVPVNLFFEVVDLGSESSVKRESHGLVYLQAKWERI